ncbi:unnamed protein product [Phaedon cochleariae]|uniref:Endonuclease-reverse transcriptase n=1 Tax=Phaedon cochleariae TaxID=80249 RepID=A0A9N9S8X6_PHACE|nr:unnamed protein product [Phaedon cochleariae]
MDEETKSLIKSIYLQNNEIKQDIQIIRGDLQVVSKKISELEKKVEILETENEELKCEIETERRKQKNNNLVIFGIEEAEETETLKTVQETIQEKLNIKLENADVNNTFRIGKRNTTRKRPVILELVRNLKKQEILKNCFKLKGTDISVSHDLTESERKEKKVLYKHYREAKEEKLETTLLKNKLIINGATYTYKDFLKEPNSELNIKNPRNSSETSSKRKNALSPQEGTTKRFTRSVSKEEKNTH